MTKSGPDFAPSALRFEGPLLSQTRFDSLVIDSVARLSICHLKFSVSVMGKSFQPPANDGLLLQPMPRHACKPDRPSF